MPKYKHADMKNSPTILSLYIFLEDPAKRPQHLQQSWTKPVATNGYHTFFANVLTYRQVKKILLPPPPVQCCFMGFAIHSTLFSNKQTLTTLNMEEKMKKE